MTVTIDKLRLETPLGTPEVWCFEKAIVVGGGKPHNVDESAETALTINGVSYSVRADFKQWADGTFHLGEEPNERNAYQAVSLTRRDKIGYYESQPTNAALERAQTVLLAAVNEWATSYDGRAAMEVAIERDRREAEESLFAMLDKCDEAAAVVRDQIDRCRAGQPFNKYPVRIEIKREALA